MQPAGDAARQCGDNDFIVGLLFEGVTNPADWILVPDFAIHGRPKVTQPSYSQVQLPLRGFIGVFVKRRVEFGGHITRRRRRGDEKVEMGFFFRKACRYDRGQIIATQ